ncbi:tRNA (guanine-N(7)-)-methyltransferase [Alphaproteobacteria bacterium]|nr:tRNA (guanine-N(7)-)-methyltransferase [Alphaproteobacteria bacterium]
MSQENVNQPRFFGRRKGKPLRAGRAELLETLLPAVRFSGLPEGAGEAWLEIGFGAGEHVAELAAANPSRLFVGAEVFVNGIASMLRHISERGLRNVRLIADDVRGAYPLFPDGSLARAYLLFPDPWPKTRHESRRFVNPGNLDFLARALRAGGQFIVASDCDFYIAWTRARLAERAEFRETYASSAPPEGWVPTRYERKAKAGPPFYLIYERV